MGGRVSDLAVRHLYDVVPHFWQMASFFSRSYFQQGAWLHWRHLPWAMSLGRRGYLKNSVLSAPGIDDRQNFADLSTSVRRVILGVSSSSL
jgi:hypothetical protein